MFDFLGHQITSPPEHHRDSFASLLRKQMRALIFQCVNWPHKVAEYIFKKSTRECFHIYSPSQAVSELESKHATIMYTIM